MEGQNKHFSHIHNLNLHQLAEGGILITCSGCNSPCNGIIYACSQCNFILHEQCYHASRSFKHPSHPSHPLALLPYPTYPTNSFYCNSCSQVGTGFSYSCPDCEFDLHVQCAYTTVTKSTILTPNTLTTLLPNPPISDVDPINYPLSSPWTTDSPSTTNDQPAKVKTQGIKHFGHPHALQNLKPGEDSLDCSLCEEVISDLGYACPKSKCDFHLHKSCFELAKEIRHKSHTKHALTLRSSANKYYTQFSCNACSNNIEGFMYHCAKCDVSIHVKCVSLPDDPVKRKDHKHPLKLFYSSPSKCAFCCDACNGMVNDDCWTYFCKECDYGVHLVCVNYEEENPDGENSDEESDEASQVDDESDQDEESPDGEKSEEKSVGASQVDDESDPDEEQVSSTGNVFLDAQLHMQRLQLQTQMARQNAQFVMSMGSSLANLV